MPASAAKSASAAKAGAESSASFVNRMRLFLRRALRSTSGNKAFIDIARVSDEVAERVKQETGLDVAGFTHSLDEAATRHILKKHGDAKTEAQRGQLAITQEDFARLDEVVSAPDAIERGHDTPDGHPTVVFSKEMGGTVYYVQQVRSGRNKLAAVTLWKARNVPPAAVETGLVHTSETSVRDTSTSAASVAPKAAGGKKAKKAKAGEAGAPKPAAGQVKTDSFANRLRLFIGQAMSRKRGSGLSFGIAPVSKAVADEYLSLSGRDIAGRMFVLDEADARRILNEGKRPAAAAVAVAVDDLQKLQQVVAEPDNIRPSRHIRREGDKHVLILTRTIGGTIYEVSLTPGEGNKMAVLAAYKVPLMQGGKEADANAADAANAGSVAATPDEALKAARATPAALQTRGSPLEDPKAVPGWEIVGTRENGSPITHDDGSELQGSIDRNPKWQERDAVVVPFEHQAHEGGPSDIRYVVMARQSPKRVLGDWVKQTYRQERQQKGDAKASDRAAEAVRLSAHGALDMALLTGKPQRFAEYAEAFPRTAEALKAWAAEEDGEPLFSLGGNDETEAETRARREREAAEAKRQFAETERLYGGRDAYDKAKAAGQTKLDYRQWVQVRTPAFKAWFGDWELARLQRDMRRVRGSGQAKVVRGEVVGRVLVNRASGFEATVSGESFGKMMSRSNVERSVSSQAHLQALGNIDKLFELAQVREVRAPRKQKDVGDIAAVHHFEVPMPFDGQVLRVKIMGKVFTLPEKGNRLYLIEAVELDGTGVTGEDPVVSGSFQRGDATSSPPPGAAADFARMVAAVKGEGVSKAIDKETGEPLADSAIRFSLPDSTDPQQAVKAGRIPKPVQKLDAASSRASRQVKDAASSRASRQVKRESRSAGGD